MYSALKRDGQKLVDLARQGITIERQARKITIHALTCTPTDHPAEYSLDVRCSGGTYIRTLCADIGAALGCGGVMSALCRTEACGFPIERAHTLDELEQMELPERLSLLIPTVELFGALPSLTLSSFYYKLIRNGCAVALAKLRAPHPCGTRLRLYAPDGTFFALGEVVTSEEGLALKAIKIFSL
jgi:tRNA pseudouridine55 synthase